MGALCEENNVRHDDGAPSEPSELQDTPQYPVRDRPKFLMKVAKVGDPEQPILPAKMPATP